MDAETYTRMPERLSMRETKVGGRALVTTFTDARAVSAADLDALYCRRWQVEAICVRSRRSWTWASCAPSPRP